MATKIRSDDFENLLHCLMKTYLKFRFQRGLESDYEERAGLFPSRLPVPSSRPQEPPRNVAEYRSGTSPVRPVHFDANLPRPRTQL